MLLRITVLEFTKDLLLYSTKKTEEHQRSVSFGLWPTEMHGDSLELLQFWVNMLYIFSVVIMSGLEISTSDTIIFTYNSLLI